jgi:hypothetical protein
MNMWPFFCFYGGKWRAAPHYPTPKYTRLVEPFAGAAGYATRHYTQEVVLVERDPVIAALWRYLIGVTSDEVRRIPLLGVGQTVADLSVCDEARSLVGFWVNKGTATPGKSQSSWMRQGIRPKSFWGQEIRERIALQVEGIRHWRVTEGSYAEAPDYHATWFVDPPYQGAGRWYRFHEIDFAALSKWVRAREGLVIACENEGATWLPFVPFKKIKANESKHRHKVSAEAVWSFDTGCGRA